jgi:signal recognition particle GTPase
MILVKTLIFLFLILIISHIHKKWHDRNNQREGFNHKISNKKQSDKLTKTSENQSAIVNKIKEFKLDGDMNDLQDKLQELLTLSDASTKINNEITQQK